MQLIDRALNILTILSKEQNGLSVSEISEKIDAPKSSTHRILQALVKNRFVSQSYETKKYLIGYKLLTLTNNITKENSLSVAAKPYMKELSEKIKKTITLSILEGESLICIDYEEGPEISMFLIRTGFAMPPHATSAGKAILAYQPDYLVKEIFKHSVEKITERTHTDVDAFLIEMSEVRERGYATVDEELQMGVVGVACPIFDSSGKAVAAIAYTSLKNQEGINEQYIEMLKEYAELISSDIGG